MEVPEDTYPVMECDQGTKGARSSSGSPENTTAADHDAEGKSLSFFQALAPNDNYNSIKRIKEQSPPTNDTWQL
jgi:hypothetical protein